MNKPSTPPVRARASMREVAERAGVALSSVSRVLSGHPDVSTLMRNRVLDAVAALGYEPDILAQSLRTGATMTVGFAVGDISNPLLAQIVLGAETTLRAAGYSMQLSNSMSDPDLDNTYIRLFRQRRVDGLLLSLASETDEQTKACLRSIDIPYVLVDRGVSEARKLSAVLSDHTSGMLAAVHHLLLRGHRRIALINGNPAVRPARTRAAVLVGACGDVPGAVPIVREGAFDAEYGELATSDLLGRREPPTALIVGGNQILPGVLRAVRAAGLHIPTDVSVITCDDIPLAEFLDPPLATISRDPRAMGTAAAELLLERIAGKPPRIVTLPTGFRSTPSCGTVRRNDG